jgi:hypothetical protein
VTPTGSHLPLFGQQHARTAEWFRARHGQAHTIEVGGWPHVAALQDDPGLYLEYLAASWAGKRRNTDPRRRAQLAKFLRLRDDINAVGVREPARHVLRPDGRRIVVDGNHRSAIGYVDGVDVPGVDIAAPFWLAETTHNPAERYGSRTRGIPYQSIFHDNAEIIVGRRRDTLDRHALLDPADLAGRTVLDVGCNIGGASLLAAAAGASVLGVDVSARIVTAAVRVAAFCAADVRYAVADLDAARFAGFDTVLCFSVLAHLRDRAAIRETCAAASVVYIEGHEHWTWDDVPIRDLFRQVDQVGGDRRRLWRCER